MIIKVKHIFEIGILKSHFHLPNWWYYLPRKLRNYYSQYIIQLGLKYLLLNDLLYPMCDYLVTVGWQQTIIDNTRTLQSDNITLVLEDLTPPTY